MTTDGGLRKLERQHLAPRGFDLFAIETGPTTSGLPDVYWTHPASRSSGWIENKKTSGWAIEVRPHQLGFARRADAAGVRHVVAVRASGAGSGGGRGDSLWLVRGSHADVVEAGGLRALEAAPEGLLYRGYGGPRDWDWDAVRAALLG